MKLSEYNYSLPKDKIAQHPPKTRGKAKLLVLDKSTGKVSNQNYSDCINYLNSGDVLILNNTKVIKARLFTEDSSGNKHELILLEKHGKTEDKFHHKVIYRGKLKKNDILLLNNIELKIINIEPNGIALIESSINLETVVNEYGKVPLPPYMKRQATIEDEKRYQTEFAKEAGSVAAPTASLNMTTELLEQIKAKRVKIVYITLHVGLGTFLPIRTDDISKHTMHSEWYYISSSTIDAIQKAKVAGNKVTAVGTTVARTLEYASDEILSSFNNDLFGEADIFIYPGYKFKLVDQLLTNFHAPKSTVLMLAAAFAGWDNLEAAYNYALLNNYKFLSYGDSMLIT